MVKTFTLAEAQMLLPVLEALLRKAQEAAARVDELDGEMQELNRRIFLAGGMHINVTTAARRRAEREKAAQDLKSAVDEMTEIGVRVHDMTAGMLDFPTLVNGQTVLLCWRMGEATILHWHEQEAGTEAPVSRKPIDQLFGRVERERPN